MAFAFTAFFFGATLSLMGLFLGEMSHRRYPSMRQVLVLLIYGLLDSMSIEDMSSFNTTTIEPPARLLSHRT